MKRVALMAVLLLVAILCGACGSAMQSGKQSSSIYYFSTDATTPLSVLGTYVMHDTGTSSGSYEIYELGQPTGTEQVVYISGTGPDGTGHYMMKVAPDKMENASIYFYVSAP
jgi:hypothetical protein